MNKLITKIVGAALGLTMAVGVGVGFAVGSGKEAVPVRADGESTYTIGWGTASGTSGTYTNFTTNSGSVNGILSWSSAKNSSSNDPAYNSGASELRLYYNSGGDGGSITITPASGITFTGFVMTTSTSPSVKYTADGGTATSVSASNNTYTVSDIEASSSLVIQNVNTTNTQLRIKTIELTYTTSGSQPSYLSVTYDLNGGTGGTVTDSTEYESGDTVTVLGIGSVTKTDYSFINWSDGNGGTYDEGDEFTITSNVTLTAQWQYKQYDDDTTNNKITWNLAGPSYVSASTDQISWTSPKATMVVDKASASSNANNYCPPTQTSTRLYTSSVLTITPVSGYQINSVVFTATTAGYATALSGSTWTNATASASSTTVTVTPTNKKNAISATIGGTTGHTSVVVNYAVASSTPTLTLSTNSVSLKTNESEGVTVTATVDNVASPVYDWSTEDTNITLGNASTSTVTIYPNTSVSGSATVHIAITGTSLSGDVTVTISVPGPGETAETAYTVAQAIAAIDAGEGITNVYAKGIVSSLYSSSVSSGKISYYISDDGSTTSDQLEAYNGKGLNNTNFTSIDDVQVGDAVVIYGTLKKYQSTYEFDNGNYLVSQTRKNVNSIALNPTTITVAPNATGNVLDLFTSIVIDQDDGLSYTSANIVWTSNDTNVFEITNGAYEVTGEHKDSATITGTLKGVTATATINVVDANHPYLNIDLPDDWTLVTDPSTLVAGDSIIITGTNNSTTYAAGTYSTGNNVRADSDNTLTISGTKATGVVSTMVYTLVEGTETGSLAFRDSAGKYLYAASSSSNYMKSQDNVDGNASFVLNSDGTVVAQGTNTRNYMRFNYNSGSPIFACYASNSTTGTIVTFYKNEGGRTTIDVGNDILTDLDDYYFSGDFFECDPDGVSFDSTGWNEVGEVIGEYLDTYKLNYAISNESGNKVEQFLATYDYVIGKKLAGYSAYADADDYLNRVASGKATAVSSSKISSLIISNNNNATAIIVVISLVSLAAVGGYFFIRKRKEQ